MKSSPEGDKWNKESAYKKAKRGLETEAQVRGTSEEDEFKRRMKELGHHVVSPGGNRKIAPGVISKLLGKRKPGH